MFYQGDAFQLALENDYFRKSLVTGKHSQVDVMSIPVGKDVGEEQHKVDQIFLFISGMGEAIINGKKHTVGKYQIVFVPAGSRHNIKNIGVEPLKFMTVYAPVEHEEGLIEKTKPS